MNRSIEEAYRQQVAVRDERIAELEAHLRDAAHLLANNNLAGGEKSAAICKAIWKTLNTPIYQR